MLKKQEKKNRRHKKVRAKISGTAKAPRLCVFRTSRHIYAQLIDDDKGKTILSSSDLELKNLKLPPRLWRGEARSTKLSGKTQNLNDKKEETKTRKVVIAYEIGKLIAEKAKEKKIAKVVFDRGGYKYHGRVKAVAEGAREGGLKF